MPVYQARMSQDRYSKALKNKSSRAVHSMGVRLSATGAIKFPGIVYLMAVRRRTV